MTSYVLKSSHTSRNLTSGTSWPNDDNFNLSIGDAKAANISIHALALGMEQRPLFLHFLLGVSRVSTTEGIKYRGDPFAITIPRDGRAKEIGRAHV